MLARLAVVNPGPLFWSSAQQRLYFGEYSQHVIRYYMPATGLVHTYAGGTGATTADSALPLLAGVPYPRGLTMDSSGRMFVTQYDSHCVRAIEPSGAVWTIAGVCGALGNIPTQVQMAVTAASARFYYPAGIAVDPTDDSVVICDRNNHFLRRLSRNATGWFVSNVAGTGSTGTLAESGIALSQPLVYPTSLVVSPAGVIFVHTYGNPCIIVKVEGGLVNTFALSGTAGNPLAPTGALLGQTGNDVLGLALAPNGDLYISEWCKGSPQHHHQRAQGGAPVSLSARPPAPANCVPLDFSLPRTPSSPRSQVTPLTTLCAQSPPTCATRALTARGGSTARSSRATLAASPTRRASTATESQLFHS